MTRIYWAKPDQTYQDHICASYRAWKETVRRKKGQINRLGKICGFEPERFLKSSLLSVVLHDLGKITREFQEMMEHLRGGYKPNLARTYRHEIVSYPFTLAAAYSIQQEDGPLLSIPFPFEALAVLGHHKPLNPEMSSFSHELTAPTPEICEEGVQQAVDQAGEIFKKEGFSLPEFVWPTRNPVNEVTKLIGNTAVLGLLTTRCSDPDHIRTTYILLKGILHYADWHGSAGIPLNYAPRSDVPGFMAKIARRCAEKNMNFVGLHPFQAECASTLGHCIASAPTGTGKTEASILWALRNLEDMGSGKLIYLLPTMVTANSIYHRLCQFFGEQNVGISHSHASLLFSDEEEDRNLVRHALFDKTFMPPVTVATIDQLLLAGFNTGKWVVTESNAMNAAIIIDEIHAYDPWTFGLVLEMIRHFTKYGARVMLMSATLPEYLLNPLRETIPYATLIQDPSLLSHARNTFSIVDESIEEAVDDIAKAVKSGKKTLVVVNSVGSCQEMYRTLKDLGLQPVCYHSKFTLRDRRIREDRIEEGEQKGSPLLLVATQVVEVSLDIDFDIMFTECAPPDAIVQRAGRVNRRRKKEGSHITIYRHSCVSEKIYDPDRTGLLERSFNAFMDGPSSLTESDLISIVESVYKDRDIRRDPRFQEAIAQYSLTQKNLLRILDNPGRDPDYEVTRKVDYPQVSVIPLIFRHEVRKMKPRERMWYEVKMPLWYVKKHRMVEGDVVYCEMNYDSDAGARFTDAPEMKYMVI